MGTIRENNPQFKLPGIRRVTRPRKLPVNLAEFLGEFPANPRLSELIIRAVTSLKERPDRMPTENEAFALGILAYIYSFPIVEMFRALFPLVSADTPETKDLSEGWNRLQVISEISDRSRKIVKTNDVAYCVAPLDLSREPVLVYASDPGDRYCSFQFIDAHAATFAHIGTRDKDRYERIYAIVGPGWRGKLSPGLTRIQSVTHQNLLIGRIGLDDDLGSADAIFSRSTLAPLSRFEKENGNDLRETRWRPHGQEVDLRDLKWFEFASDALNANPPPACGNDITSLFARIGLEPGFEFRAKSVSPNVRSGLKRAIPVAKNEIVGRAKSMGETSNGWHTFSLDGRTQRASYLDRAADAINRLTEPPADELFSAECRTDECGRPLTGTHPYMLRFERGSLPPTDSLWSISAYDQASHCLIDKVLDGAPGVENASLIHGHDGSVEIRIQSAEPESSGCNWLRSPRSRFSISFRGYAPREEIVSGQYRLPVVRPLTNG